MEQLLLPGTAFKVGGGGNWGASSSSSSSSRKRDHHLVVNQVHLQVQKIVLKKHLIGLKEL
ncbi:hypothetical protein SD457_06155 [Coprobacillaceae bacterium CR2/5/TPMF4]|nr:hypothetical protein SD457_06155 [Coprobacillaceae bacterium CR2/5/TPMF4]